LGRGGGTLPLLYLTNNNWPNNVESPSKEGIARNVRREEVKLEVALMAEARKAPRELLLELLHLGPLLQGRPRHKRLQEESATLIATVAIAHVGIVVRFHMISEDKGLHERAGAKVNMPLLPRVQDRRPLDHPKVLELCVSSLRAVVAIEIPVVIHTTQRVPAARHARDLVTQKGPDLGLLEVLKRVPDLVPDLVLEVVARPIRRVAPRKRIRKLKLKQEQRKRRKDPLERNSEDQPSRCLCLPHTRVENLPRTKMPF
jgi:hypothetical protein